MDFSSADSRIVHSVINSLSAFANTEGAPAWHGIAGSLFFCVVSLAYAVYIINTTKEEKAPTPKVDAPSLDE